MCVLGAANTDPGKWHNAQSFDITRNCVGHMEFGSGIHACVGQHVARSETEALFGELIPRVKRLRRSARRSGEQVTHCELWSMRI